MNKKILICMSSLSKTNGVATFVMNYYDELLRNNYIIDFFLMKKNISNERYIKKIEVNNGKIFYMSETNKRNRYKNVKNYLQTEILSKNQYDIVHVNLVDIYALACINGAKSKKIKNIIYHIHNPRNKSNMMVLRDFINYLCIKNATHLAACSKDSAKSMFKNNKCVILNNSIDVEKYKFNNCMRCEIRNKLKLLDSEIVIGTVARLTDQKNPYKIIEIIQELLKNNSNVKFLWVGDGDLKEKINTKIEQEKILDKFIILGNQENVERFYSAMDIFLLPSKFEGLGIVFLEAQASGLLTYASNVVPKDAQVTDLLHFIDINKTSAEWSEIINKDIMNNKCIDLGERIFYNEIVKNSEFNIKNKKNDLIKYYDNIINGMEENLC